MKLIKIIAIILFITIALTACNKPSFLCPDGAIEWVDSVMINDVKYYQSRTNDNIQLDKGVAVGEVSYKMADNACSDHRMKNGHAAYLREGTTIYEVKGYPASLLVLANDKVYKVNENKNAETVEELYPIKEKVADIKIVSTVDGSKLHTFSVPSRQAFLEEWLKLKVVDQDELNDKGSFKGKRIFLDILLDNGMSIRVVYRVESNVFHHGAVGNEEIKKIMKEESSYINQ